MNNRPKSADFAIVTANKKLSQTDLSAVCELNSMPPVCDNEHMTGYCFCHLCTCGWHKCPGDYKRTLFSSSNQFITNYYRNYPRKKSNVVIHKPMPEFHPASYDLNSRTMSQTQFKKQEFIKSEPFGPDRSQTASLKFISTSSYNRNYKQYNESFLDKQYVMEFDRGRSQSKVSGETLYQESFSGKDLKVYEANQEIAKKNKERSQGVKGIISTYNGFLGNSSQKKDFQKINPKVPKLAGGYCPTLETPNFRTHLTSTYKEAFKNPNFTRKTNKKFTKIQV